MVDSILTKRPLRFYIKIIIISEYSSEINLIHIVLAYLYYIIIISEKGYNLVVG